MLSWRASGITLGFPELPATEHVATLFCFIFVNDYVVLDNLIKI